MAPTMVGRDITVFEPTVWFSPNVGTEIIPKLAVGYKEDWGGGWFKVHYTANGVQWTFVSPKQDITTDEVGVFKTVPAGTHTINATFQSRAPFMELIQKIANLRKTQVAARPEIVEIQFGGGATAAQPFTIALPGLNGLELFQVTPAGTDTTPELVAAKVRTQGATFVGWTVSGTGASVIFTRTTPGFVKGNPAFTAGTSGVTVTTGFPKINQQGHTAIERYNQDPTAENGFLLGVDGTFKANSLRATAGRVRMIAYYVEQTDNPQIHYRKLGNDALLQPTLTSRCLASVIDPATQLAPSGMSTSDVDEEGRLDWWII